MLVIAFIGYKFLLIIYPNLIKDWWRLKNISGIFLFGVPVEEIVWFTLYGLLFGPIYDFWTTQV